MLAAYMSAITSALKLSLHIQLTKRSKTHPVLSSLSKVTQKRQYLKTHGPRHCTWGLVLLHSKWTSSVLPVVTLSGLSKTHWLRSMHGWNSTKVHIINARSYQMLSSLYEWRIPETMGGGQKELYKALLTWILRDEQFVRSIGKWVHDLVIFQLKFLIICLI